MSKLLPKDDEWLDNLHQKANQNLGNPPENADESFWVKLPPNKDARRIRENLLRESFGFDKADIVAYVRATKNEGFYINDSNHPEP